MNYLEYYFSENPNECNGDEEWLDFIKNLFDKIKSGYYVSRKIGFTVPLFKVQKQILLRDFPDIPLIFLEDVNVINGSKI